MKRKYSNLFSPLTVGGLTLRNRIFSAPMAFPDINTDGTLNPEAAAFYELRAKGGAAVVVVSECIVESTYGRSHNLNIFMDAPNALAGLANTAAAIKRHGAVACAELNHSGKHSGADNIDKSKNKGNTRYGPSREVLSNGSVIEEMSKEWIKGIVEAFGRAAALAKKAGFEMILLHAGHGWLLQQFMSPHDNKRSDEYGGPLENRCRLTLEVINAIRAEVGPGFPIEIRMSAEEYLEDGYHIEDFIEIAKLVEPWVDILHISTGSHEDSFDKTHQPLFVARGGLTHFAAEVKKHVKKPVATIGALSEPGMMDELIGAGTADIVYMGRQLLADPDWPRKALTGREDEIVRCCRCFTCMGERMSTGRRICALNPVIGIEYELRFAQPPSKPKKVLVAGGGPGGLTAALEASKLGHSVVLCEKEGSLGGALRCERAVPFKQDLFRFIETREAQLKKAGVEIRLNTEVTPGYAEAEGADALIVAVGAQPVIPPIPGIDGDNVITAHELSEPGIKIGKQVVILGGGLVGCETAIHLALEGRAVTVVEMLDTVAPDANGRHRPILLEYLNRLASVKTGLRGLRVTGEGLVCADRDGKEILLKADTIICCTGQRSNRQAAEALRDAAPEVMEIGDCSKVATVTQAISRGFWAARDL